MTKSTPVAVAAVAVATSDGCGGVVGGDGARGIDGDDEDGEAEGTADGAPVDALDSLVAYDGHDAGAGGIAAAGQDGLLLDGLQRWVMTVRFPPG